MAQKNSAIILSRVAFLIKIMDNKVQPLSKEVLDKISFIGNLPVPYEIEERLDRYYIYPQDLLSTLLSPNERIVFVSPDKFYFGVDKVVEVDVYKKIVGTSYDERDDVGYPEYEYCDKNDPDAIKVIERRSVYDFIDPPEGFLHRLDELCYRYDYEG